MNKRWDNQQKIMSLLQQWKWHTMSLKILRKNPLLRSCIYWEAKQLPTFLKSSTIKVPNLKHSSLLLTF